MLDQDAAKNLALAFLRKAATSSRYMSRVIKVEETNAGWIFNFYHRQWRTLRRTDEPYGWRIMVDKKAGNASHHATLRN